jgi:excisionase family DNA binding protein
VAHGTGVGRRPPAPTRSTPRPLIPRPRTFPLSFPAAFPFASRDRPETTGCGIPHTHRARDGPASAGSGLTRGFREDRREYTAGRARTSDLGREFSASSDARCAADNPAMSRRRARRRPSPPGTDGLGAGPAHQAATALEATPPGDGPAVPVAGRLEAVSGHRALLLGVEDAAAALGIGRTKTYELIATGELEVVHIGRCCRVPTDALEAYVARLRGIPGPEDSFRSRPARPAPENRP